MNLEKSRTRRPYGDRDVRHRRQQVGARLSRPPLIADNSSVISAGHDSANYTAAARFLSAGGGTNILRLDMAGVVDAVTGRTGARHQDHLCCTTTATLACVDRRQIEHFTKSPLSLRE